VPVRAASAPFLSAMLQRKVNRALCPAASAAMRFEREVRVVPKMRRFTALIFFADACCLAAEDPSLHSDVRRRAAMR